MKEKIESKQIASQLDVNVPIPNVKVFTAIPNAKHLNALRNSGYNNYTAIADIVDNSLEEDIDSKNVYIKIKLSGTKEEFIKICDDGCGMNFETLKEAITIGSNSQKTSADLGYYGTGLKSASLSIGKRLTIKTKSKDDVFYILVLDFDEFCEKNNWKFAAVIGSDEEYEQFKIDTKSETGTIVEISKLDRLKQRNITTLKNMLIKKLGLIYKYFINEKNIRIYVNDEKVIGLDPMHRDKHYSIPLSSLNETFDYNGKTYVYNVYYLDRAFKETLEKETWDKVNSGTRGLYIYRNFRLVGEHLGLGIISSENRWNPMRVELLVDGENDNVFASTFNKIIKEEDHKDLDQGFRDALAEALKVYIKDVYNRYEEYSQKNKEHNEEREKELDDMVILLNKKRKILEIPKIKDVTDKPKSNRSEHVPHEKQEKEDKPRIKKDDPWLTVKYDVLGDGKIFDTRMENGMHHIIINESHVFYTEFFRKAPIETQKMFVYWFSSSSVALQRIKSESEENYNYELLLDNYHEALSKSIRKLILY